MTLLKHQKIVHLRQQLITAGAYGTRPKPVRHPCPLRSASNDFAADFPFDLLQKAALNEVMPAHYGDISPYGFALLTVRNLTINGGEKTLWCTTSCQSRETGRLFASGLKTINLDPACIIQLEARRTIDVLWAMEEAARSGVFKVVVGTIDNLTFTQSRRLSLAAAHGKTPIFMLRPHNTSGASTAFSRWRIASQPSKTNHFNNRAPGRAAFEIKLSQCRDGRTGKWTCHYEPSSPNLKSPNLQTPNRANKTHHLPVSAAPANRAPVTLEKRTG